MLQTTLNRGSVLPIEKPAEPRILGIFERPRINIALDFGTANTVLATLVEEEIPEEKRFKSNPSVFAFDASTKKITAIGEKAARMIGKSPKGTSIEWPVLDGVVGDPQVAKEILTMVLGLELNEKQIAGARVFIGIPCNTPEVYRNALEEAVFSNRAAEIYMVEQPLAAAIGVGLPIEDPEGRMIIDLGGGTVCTAEMALGRIVYSDCNNTLGGKHIDRALKSFFRKEFNMNVDERRIEDLKKLVSKHKKTKEEKVKETFSIDGTGTDGLPKSIKVTLEDMDRALAPLIGKIVEAAKKVISRSDEAVVADLKDTGIFLTGGGALLRGLDFALGEELGLPVKVAENPLLCVIKGLYCLMTDHDALVRSAHYFNTLEEWKKTEDANKKRRSNHWWWPF